MTIEPQQKSSSKSKTRFLALTSSFAVIYATLRIIPTFPVVGVPGASFSSSDILVPLYGIILGPIFGAASIILGTFLAVVLGKPLIFLGLDFLPATFGAIAVGLLARGKRAVVIAIFAVVLAIFLVHPLSVVLVSLSFATVPFNWMHIVVFALLFTPLASKAPSWIASKSIGQVTKGLAILAITGTMMQHVVGGVVFETVLGFIIGRFTQEQFVGIWTTIFFVYPIERIVLVAASILLGTPLLRNLGLAGLDRKYLG
ncbi:MAG: hypothetical protein FJ358_01065 [Thaumarchaeota archaeon]|nr:hypothetical protein [Nitrososphaerota archaeon]